MTRFRNEAGRLVSARSGSFLERRLLRDGWTAVSEEPSALPKPNLAGKTRAELNAIATEVGVDSPESLPNIDSVKRAIEEVFE